MAKTMQASSMMSLLCFLCALGLMKYSAVAHNVSIVAVAHFNIQNISHGMPFIHTQRSSLPWTTYCGQPSYYNQEILESILSKYNASKPHALAYMIRDLSPTIIHDYRQVTYPLLTTCVAISKPAAQVFILKSNFYIDPAYELILALPNVTWTHIEELRPPGSMYPCRNRGNPSDDLSVAVKTTQKYHKTRIPVLKKHGFKRLDRVLFFSEAQDASVPTIQVPIPNSGDQGHCAKLHWILQWMYTHTTTTWIIVADDDTALDTSALQLDIQAGPVIIGERYRYGSYDYITGGGGMLLNRHATARIISECHCQDAHTYDDMWLGRCATELRIPMHHHTGFHQARPQDYHPLRLDTEPCAISFHKTMEFSKADWVYWMERDDPQKHRKKCKGSR